MIKPDFSITQDAEFLYIKILIKYVKITNAEFDIEENNFKFYCKPYLLDLYFPAKIANDERAKSSYDVEKGELLCKIPKEQKGQHFENLDMITTLFKPKNDLPMVSELSKQKKNNSPLIEVISSMENVNISESKTQNTANKEEIKNTMPETEKPMEILVAGPPKYGFNKQYSQVFQNLIEEKADICDIDIEKICAEERWTQKTMKENSEFDYDRYISDTFECPELNDIILFENPLIKNLDNKLKSEEYETLKKLPNKEYLINNEKASLLQIIDILYAYSYDQRTNCFDFSSESNWNITKLSNTFSCFCDMEDIASLTNPIKNLLISLYRRTLIYPLYRKFDLCEIVKKDLVLLISKGKLEIVRSLLNVKRIFEKSEPKYLLNKIFVDDFIIWIQKVEEAKIQELAKIINETIILKEDLGLDLLEYEDLYKIAQQK